ncbi:addiction module RelB/DinJ family antitoxin [Pseudomonas sp. BE134]|nr:addiction module RelB/DinJ family antitoxin [Pseudomonas sp. BE134]
MASINVRVDDDLKNRAYRELERLGVTPSELMNSCVKPYNTLQSVASSHSDLFSWQKKIGPS